MSEEHRGILAFFVMISSIFPIVFLGFDMLNFIGSVSPLWPFMIFATVWIVLLWMGVRILRGRRPGSTRREQRTLVIFPSETQSPRREFFG
jgi:hypothetical protein